MIAGSPNKPDAASIVAGRAASSRQTKPYLRSGIGHGPVPRRPAQSRTPVRSACRS